EDAWLPGGRGDLGPRRDAHGPPVDGGSDPLVAHATMTGFRRPAMSSSNSFLNFLIPDTTGAAHESDSTQIVFPVMFSERSSSRSRSASLPCPERIRSRILVVHAVPSRHWVHWAHDSCA